ncbi:MAG: DUF2782 domain-containing protein [Desulfuromusa sp.]|jgi:hypothetical protein|nr:DUF2782 domain-containing protein [Desulfuromusa sp.]
MALRIGRTCFTLIFLFALSGLAIAEEEPDIQIRYGDDQTIYEYRIKGKLMEIKIVPKVGPAYYLVRTEDGEFEQSETSGLVFPSWKLIEW